MASRNLERNTNMAENLNSGVEDVDVEEIGSDDDDSSDEPEVEVEEEEEDNLEEEPTEDYNVEAGERTDDDELQRLQLEEGENEVEGEEVQGEGEEVEEQEQELGEEIDLQGLSEALRVEADVLKSLVGVDERFPVVMSHFVQLLNAKTEIVDEYEATVRQFSVNLDTADQTLRELLACVCTHVGVL